MSDLDRLLTVLSGSCADFPRKLTYQPHDHFQISFYFRRVDSQDDLLLLPSGLVRSVVPVVMEIVIGGGINTFMYKYKSGRGSLKVVGLTHGTFIPTGRVLFTSDTSVR